MAKLESGASCESLEWLAVLVEERKDMRKLIVLSFITLDGVMQAPGAPEEDLTGGFLFGGWVVPYFDDFLGKIMVDQLSRPFDLLLGRKTYEIFAAHWPYQDTESDPIAAGINNARKFVASHASVKLGWSNSIPLVGNVVAEVKKLKMQDGPDLQVHGSCNLIQTLLKHDLIDEFWLKIFPITLGSGKRLFGAGSLPVGFKLRESITSPSGVIVASYERAGDVKTGSFALASPTEAELARRKKMLDEQ
jgi:dihydrofolate reductase